MSKKKSAKKSPVSKGVEKKHLEELDVTDGKDRNSKEEQIEKEKERWFWYGRCSNTFILVNN
jgi:hypothetical protein